MAMETAMPTGIRPIERPQGPQTTGVQRRGQPSVSPFAPRTDVDLQNSVADVAGLLSKIASAKEDAMDKISPQIQKLIDKIMQQSFSLEATLAEGLGTTLESQRFAIDQLFTLSRMLYQMGSLSEQGKPAALSDEMQALLSNFKELVTTMEGNDMEPTMLHKLAFEVLDGKQANELPAMMQFMLMQQAAGGELAPQAESDSLAFLKHLMDYFMPRPAVKETAPQEQSAQQNASGETAKEAPAGQENVRGNAQTRESAQTQEPANARQGAETRETAPQRQTQETLAGQENAREAGTAQQSKGSENAAPQQSAEGAPKQAQNAQEQPRAQESAQQSAPQGQAAKSDSAAARRGGESNAQIYAWENEAAEEQSGTTQKTGADPQDPFAELMRKGLERMRGRLQQQPTSSQQAVQEESASSQTMFGRTPEPPPMQNTPRTMETMRDLASLLLKDAELSPEDERLLTDFVNGEQTMLSEKEAKELQMLLRLCEKNVPASVQQSAQQKGMEDMPRLWAFMELCDLAMIKERDGKSLKKASKSLSDFASMMKNSILPENGRTAEGHRSMSFMTPLYMSEDMQKPYPAYIHVYDEAQRDEGGGPPKKETWIRVCLLTENIGAVDVSFRMYDGSNLDVRIYFSERENIEDFRGYMDEFRASFDDKPLTLMSVKVGVAGAKT
ncbi:MAG: hypothetical protein IKW79_05310 [Schwartzia sp.]|nr:hypothetical protein [Schwartzia sp. (in: firmicutes)]